MVDSLGEDDRPFKVISGDGDDSELVDVALLEYLVEQQNELDITETEDGVRIATA